MLDPFDTHAERYDRGWGRDAVAQRFRADTHRVLARALSPGSRVLDAGCGIGLDSSALTAAGHQVVSIDASVGMVAAAQRRGVAARLLPLQRAAEVGPVDAALLNFGVINCIDPVAVAASLAEILRPGGPVMVVSMPRVHPQWLLRCLLQRDLAAAARRCQPQVDLSLESGQVSTRYWSAGALRTAFDEAFELVEQRSLGVIMPPPGGRLADKDGLLLALLDRLEDPLRSLPVVRSMGDHIVLLFRRRSAQVHGLAGREAARPVGVLRRRWRSRRARQTGEPQRLAVLVLHVTDGCNSRCLSCNFRGPAGGEALTPQVAGGLAAEAAAMGCNTALITGGEPLLRSDLAELLSAVRRAGLRPTLLTNGLALARSAAMVARWCDEVVISLDGHDADSYRLSRGVDGFDAVGAGVSALRRQAPGIILRARVTVTANNVAQLCAIADQAAAWGLSSISFLAADLSSDALARASSGPSSELGDRQALAPDPQILSSQLKILRARHPRGFLTDSDDALERIQALAQAAAAHEADGPLPATPRLASPSCDAPWTSVVVQPDLSLRPCFFHDGGGATAAHGLRHGIHALGPRLRRLDVETDPICQGCVCWARLG